MHIQHACKTQRNAKPFPRLADAIVRPTRAPGADQASRMRCWVSVVPPHLSTHPQRCLFTQQAGLRAGAVARPGVCFSFSFSTAVHACIHAGRETNAQHSRHTAEVFAGKEACSCGWLNCCEIRCVLWAADGLPARVCSAVKRGQIRLVPLPENPTYHYYYNCYFSPTPTHTQGLKRGTHGRASNRACVSQCDSCLVRGAREGWAALGRSSTWPPCNRYYCGVCAFRRRVRN